MKFQINVSKTESLALGFLFPPFPMKRLVDFFELLIRHMGINLCRGDGRMPEHFLNGANVGATLDEIGRKRMAQSVRMNVFHDSGLGRVKFHNPLNRPGSDPQIRPRRTSFGLVLDMFQTDSHEKRRVNV